MSDPRMQFILSSWSNSMISKEWFIVLPLYLISVGAVTPILLILLFLPARLIKPYL
ncbi:hypothetical protein BCV72DRAFT_237392 [Rhizopus microsporus var. microsporus]|uniref:Uncharacterized protein n=1 Tax=Rhizopus microsporus var. microsporus TaxID=86635 RepID=A0A1X0QM16_RHIZD|nr:hypothetical protein BCV72DRAFT_237392 [Rhizopus microsporus var. microsporus]